MTQDLERAPFAGSWGLLNTHLAKSYGKLLQVPGCGCYYFEGVATAELSSVWIHGTTISFPDKGSQAVGMWVVMGQTKD